MLAHLVAVFALNLVTPSTTSVPRDARPAHPSTVESTESEGVQVAPAASPLPRAPRAVKVTRTSEGSILTWRHPAGSTPSAITGYVVIVDERSTQVSASTFRAVVPAAAEAVAVATMNGVGCSLATPATMTVAPRETRPQVIASRGTR